MMLNGRPNKRTAALVCLTAFLMLGMLSNIHTDGRSCHIRTRDAADRSPSLAAWADDQHCVACELLFTNSGKLVLTANPIMEHAVASQPARTEPVPIILCSPVLADCSRAPPS